MQLRVPAWILAATIAVPVGASAAVPSRDARPQIEVRLFDRSHKDYHVWNDGEDRSYRAYLAERHRRYVVFERQKRAQQAAYLAVASRPPGSLNDRLTAPAIRTPQMRRNALEFRRHRLPQRERT